MSKGFVCLLSACLSNLSVPGLLALVCFQGAQGAWLAADPQVITDCIPPGLGATTLNWDSDGVSPVRIHVNGPDGPSMTGPSGSLGSAETGKWIGPETFFSLVDADGNELARTKPTLACGSIPPQPPPNAADSFFPLEVGNRWVYQVSDRSATSFYIERLVTGTTDVDGMEYYVVTEQRADRSPGNGEVTERWFRQAADGSIYVRPPDGAERLWLDPTGTRNDEALLEVTATGVTHKSLVGDLEGALRFRQQDGALILYNGTIAPGVGLIEREGQLIAGSSGGFYQSLDLVYARIGGTTLLSAPELAFTLSADSAVLRVSTGEVDNCMLPCYFVACGLVPPPEDPPGTYKPCFRSRMTLRNTTGSPVVLTLPSNQPYELELADERGVVVYRWSDGKVFLPAFEEMTFPPGETNYFEQLPLYSEPNVPFPPGRYRLTATIDAVNGPGYSASVDLTIE